MSHRNGLKIAGVYTAVVLGAGFASGQELLRYFVRYGKAGFLGLVCAGVLFALTGWAVLDICYREKLSGYTELINYLTGVRFGPFMEICVAVFLCVLFVTMIAAGGAVFHEAFGLPRMAGVLLIAGMCFIAMLFDMDGMVKVNTLLAPFMMAGGIAVGLYSFFGDLGARSYNEIFQSFVQSDRSWMLSAVTYSAYNIITAVSVLASMGKFVDSRKTALYGGLLSGIAMTVLAACIMLPIYLNYTQIYRYEIPMLKIVQNNGSMFVFFYLTILIAAIYTTVVSSGFGFVQWVGSRFRCNMLGLKAALTVFGVVASFIGFSTFVGYVYPVFGLVGLLEMLIILISWFFGDRHERKAYDKIGF